MSTFPFIAPQNMIFVIFVVTVFFSVLKEYLASLVGTKPIKKCYILPIHLAVPFSHLLIFINVKTITKLNLEHGDK